MDNRVNVVQRIAECHLPKIIIYKHITLCIKIKKLIRI